VGEGEERDDDDDDDDLYEEFLGGMRSMVIAPSSLLEL
jgi:hypothetical protein